MTGLAVFWGVSDSKRPDAWKGKRGASGWSKWRKWRAGKRHIRFLRRKTRGVENLVAEVAEVARWRKLRIRSLGQRCFSKIPSQPTTRTSRRQAGNHSFNNNPNGGRNNYDQENQTSEIALFILQRSDAAEAGADGSRQNPQRHLHDPCRRWRVQMPVRPGRADEGHRHPGPRLFERRIGCAAG